MAHTCLSGATGPAGSVITKFTAVFPAFFAAIGAGPAWRGPLRALPMAFYQ